MTDYYTSKSDKVEFKEIALGHYKRILEISCSEFTGGYWKYVHAGNIVNKEYQTDKRKEFTQAIELLALALFPHFDKGMKKAYEEYIEQSKKLEELNDQEKRIKIIELAKELFKQISILMFNKDYFKGRKYVEGLDGSTEL